MSETAAQNLIEAQLALENLEAQIGQSNFRREVAQTRELLESLKLGGEGSEMSLKLKAIQDRHHDLHAGQSGQLRAEIEQELEGIKTQLNPSEPAPWAEAQTRFQEIYQALEKMHLRLEKERFQLNRADSDACWTLLKSLRSELRQRRQELQGQLTGEVQTILDQATDNVRNTQHLGQARETFKALQQQFHQLPLRRDQRQAGRDHFDLLWKELQERSQQFRAERQQRQQDGMRRMEEALQNVESFLQRKEPELQVLEERFAAAHWHEVEPIEKQLNRDRRAVEDAKRRQRELLSKLGRNKPAAAAPSAETAAEPAGTEAPSSEVPEQENPASDNA